MTGGDLRSLLSTVEAAHARIAPRFLRAEPRRRALRYLCGLALSNGPRGGRRLVMRGGEEQPDGMQRLLTSAQWDSEVVRDDLQDMVAEHLGDPGGVLVVGERHFRKNGVRSAGVHERYDRLTGRVTNGQLGVFLLYVSPRGSAIVDRELYLPPVWLADPRRRRDAGLGDEVRFREVGELAALMAARTRVPAAWLVAGRPYGASGSLHTALQRRGIPHVLEVDPAEVLPFLVDNRVVAQSVDAVLGRSGHAGHGPRGADEPARPRRWNTVRWARFPLAPAAHHGFCRWLVVAEPMSPGLVRRCHVACGPTGTPLNELARAVETAERAPDCLAAACVHAGLDNYEARQRTAWYRHVTLSAIAHSCLEIARADADPARAESSPGRTAAVVMGAVGAIPRGAGHRTRTARGTSFPRRWEPADWMSARPVGGRVG
ncbi:IS701 family transposase [Streptoalloteichus hindustanus]|uniref:SRSO17 transposase n=1 Tax=Streptoalloteichus hindustanus TaxID=2017 RepID=A0A1M5PQB7_STRHI|nr:transposase [Streptoalloteichus hindustanus]SHH04017.1 SRSO17 transposase [Streptoalloteichus hindustanus]